MNRRSAALLGTTALVFAASTVSAHANDWTGAVSSNWFLGANWANPAVVPGQQDDAIINVVSPSVVASPGARAQNLDVGLNSTGALTIQAGGTLITSGGTLGDLSGGLGTVTVTGAGSQLAK